MTMTRRDFERLAAVLRDLPHPIDHAGLVRRLALEVCRPANPANFDPVRFITAAASPDALERVALFPPDTDDAWRCPCGNTPSTGGFYACLDTGEQVEPLADGPWAGRLYVCDDCGRIIDAPTLAVVGTR